MRARLPNVATEPVAFVVAASAAGILHALALRLAAARLDGDAYGAVASVVAALTALGVVLTGVQVALVRALAPLPEPTRVRRWPVLALAAGLAAIVAVAGVVSAAGGATGRLPVAGLLAVHVLLAVVAVVPQASLLATGRLARLGACLLVGALVRLALTAVAGGSLTATVAALVAAEAATLVIATAAVGRRPSPAPAAGTTSGDVAARDLALGIGALGGFWLVGGVDTVLARLVLDPIAADAYAGAAAVARAAFFVPSAIALVAFARLVATPRRSRAGRRALRAGLVATTAGALVAVTPMLVAPVTVAHAVGAPAVDRGALRALALAWAALAPAHLLVLFLVASGSRLALAPWTALPVVAIGAAVAPHTPTGLAAVVAVTALAVVAALAAPAVARTGPIVRAVPATRLDLAPGAGGDLAVVVPYFDPGEAIATTLRRLDAALAATGRAYEIVAVADGCTDGSPELVERMALPAVRSLRLPANAGKGAALRAGFAASHARAIGFVDGDGDLDPAQFTELVAVLDATGSDIVLGSKRHPASVVSTPWRRRLWSWGHQRLVRVLFRLDVADTQTGIKLLRGDVVADILPLLVEDRFAVDLELFVVARLRGWTSWVEVPVALTRRERSTVSWAAVARTARDTLRILARLHLALGYDAPPPHVGTPPAARPTAVGRAEARSTPLTSKATA